MLYKPDFSIQKRPLSDRNGKTWVAVLLSCLILTSTNAGTPFLNNNAVLSQATRATVSANGDSHAIATADPHVASAVLDWTKFNVGSGQQMTFNGGGTTFFNLVDGAAGKSQIDGIINGSAGNVWVINPAGVAFSSTAQIDIGGLFAAAAGNIPNTGALRAGTAMLPEFSSFDGKVEVDGTLFASATSVALLGKSVVVKDGRVACDGNFAAGERIVVDNVSGGKVTLKISDFADDPSVNTIELGDLNVGGSVTSLSGGESRLGNVSSTRGSINVTSHNGDIQVAPDAHIKVDSDGQGIGLYSKKGDVRVGSNASLSSANNIQIFSAMDENAQGDIVVNGKIDAANDLQLAAGNGKSASGNVDVNGTLSGDVTQVWVGDGTFTTGADSKVNGTSRVAVYANAGDTGNISISGRIEGGNVLLASLDGIALKKTDGEGQAEILSKDGDIGIYTASGDITIESGAVVKTQTERSDVGAVTLKSGTHEGQKGDIVVDGTVDAANRLFVLAGSAESAFGNVRMGGNLSGKAITIGARNGTVTTAAGSTVKGDSGVSVYANYGDTGSISISGRIEGGNVLLASPDGIALKKTDGEGQAEILSKDGDIGIYTASGDITIESGVVVKTQTERSDVGAITLISATHEGQKGDIVVDGTVDAANGLLVSAGNEKAAFGNVRMGGNLSGKDVLVKALGPGDITLQDKGRVSGKSGVTFQAGGGFTMGNGAQVKVSDGGVSVYSAVKDYEEDPVEHTGDVFVGGEINAKTDVKLVSGASGDQLSSGDVIVEGKVEAGEVLFRAQRGSIRSQVGSLSTGTEITATDGRVIFAADGGVEIGQGVEVKANEGDVYLESAVADGAKGDLVVNGNVHAAAFLDVFAGRANSASGDVFVGGELSGNEVMIRARDGSVTSHGDIGGNSFVRIYATRGTNGDITLSGSTRGGSIFCQSLHNIKVQASEDVARSSITATEGEVFFYTADGNVEIESGTIVESLRGDVNFATANEAKGKGDVAVNGDVCAAKTFRINSGFKPETEGRIVVNGNIEAQEATYIMAGIGKDANKWDVMINGNIMVGSGPLCVATGYGKGAVGGNIDIRGDLLTGLAQSADSAILVRAYNHGNISVSKGATVKALEENASVEFISAIRSEAMGDIKIDGNLLANGPNGNVRLIAGYGPRTDADVSIAGSVLAMGSGGNVMASASCGVGSHGDLSVQGKVTGDETVILRTGNGNVDIAGNVAATAEKGVVTVWAHNGEVLFNGGHVKSPDKVVLVAGKNVTQAESFVDIEQGVAKSTSLPVAMSGKAIDIVVHGDLGGGVSRPVAVDGKVYGSVDGDASIAAANGGDFRGGEGGGSPSINTIEMIGQTVRQRTYEHNFIEVDGSDSVSTRELKYKDELGNEKKMMIKELAYNISKNTSMTSITMDGFEFMAYQIERISDDFGEMGSTSTLAAGEDLSVYTARGIEAKGVLAAEGDLAVTARSFGDVSYLRAGGKLTINNVGHPKYPRIAYFESLDGKEPKINNLPNDMVIFVDGRLAGGNINIMNMFGANEAFLVSTPELKSTQGIFGNPPFLHSDLDVANPMEVSAIDYLIQEVPRLTLSSEFPADVDQKVEANGLSLKDSYWFGQERVAKRPSEATDGKVASAEE